MAAGTPPLVDVRGLTKTYTTGLGQISIFRDLSFQAHRGDLLAITGESGAGKSTLLHLLGALDSPTAGEIVVDGHELRRMSAAEASQFRNRTVGYVWQSHDLLPEFTAEENVAMPLLARGVPHRDVMERARAWLAEVELQHRAGHRSGELSGGEQQRVCLARALVTSPALLLADEPTGNLDTRTGEAVFALLTGLHERHGVTTLMVTHNADFAARCDRTLHLRDGHLTAS